MRAYNFFWSGAAYAAIDRGRCLKVEDRPWRARSASL